MEKKMLWVVSILLVVMLVLQYSFVKKVNRTCELMGGVGESMSERIDWVLEDMQKVNEMLKEISENK